MDIAGLYAQYWKAMLSYIQYKFPTLSSGDCEDVAQNSFIKAWQQIGNYNPAKGTVEGWLFNLAYWEGRNPAAKARLVVEYRSDRDKRTSPDVARLIEAREGLAGAEARVARMYSGGLQTLTVFALEGGDYAAMAVVMETTKLRANKRVTYIRQVLRQELTK